MNILPLLPKKLLKLFGQGYISAPKVAYIFNLLVLVANKTVAYKKQSVLINQDHKNKINCLNHDQN